MVLNFGDVDYQRDDDEELADFPSGRQSIFSHLAQDSTSTWLGYFYIIYCILISLPYMTLDGDLIFCIHLCIKANQ